MNGAVATRVHALAVIAFAVFVFSIPFEAVSLGAWNEQATLDGSTGLFSLAKLIGWGFFLATVLDWRRCYARVPVAVRIFGAYLCLYAWTGLWGAYPGDALRRILSLLQMGVLLCASANLLAERRTRGLVLISLALSCATFATLAAVGVLDGAMVHEVETGTEVRRMGMADDPNNVAVVIALGLMTALHLVRGGALRHKALLLLGWLAAAGMGLFVIQTGSRGGLLALCAGLVAYAFAARTPGRLLANLVALAAAVTLLVFAVLWMDTARARWMSTLYDGNTAGRDAIAAAAVDCIAAKPVLGWGPVAADYTLGRAVGTITRGTHNLGLALLLENGIAGALLYGAGLLLCLRAAWRARLGAAGELPFALVVVVLVANLSLRWDIYKLHWLVLGLALAAAPATRRLRVAPQIRAPGWGRSPAAAPSVALATGRRA